MSALVDKNGVVVGACDSGMPLTVGRWEWIATDRAMLARNSAEDTEIEIGFGDVIAGYRRLP